MKPQVTNLIQLLSALCIPTIISAAPAKPPSVQTRQLEFKPTNPAVVAWPDNRLTWCLVGSSNNDFTNSMSLAWERWKQALGPDSRMTVEKSRKETCDPNTDSSSLWVTLTSERTARTSVGFDGTGLFQGKGKNWMDFDMSEDWGLEDTVANLSSELGHALGLQVRLGEDGKIVAPTAFPSDDDVAILKELFRGEVSTN